jgi:glutamate-1-semialdehyde aminotransferase
MEGYSFAKSRSEFEKALGTMPGGVEELDKLDIPEHFPYYLEIGQGAYVWDLDGNRFIDFIAGKGAIILGYGYGRVEKAVIEQVKRGNLLSLGSSIQNELARLLVSVIPCAEKVKFLKTGSSATSAAVRIARVFSGKEIILTSGYHGWHDWSVPSNDGIPKALREYSVDFSFDLSFLEELIRIHQGNVAAIFVTPEPSFFERAFFENLRDIARKNDILLIFDEIKTGFRLAIGGAQEYYNVIPDLATFGKSMANGYCISALVGRSDVMDAKQETWLSTTFEIETVPMVAALETIHELIEKDVLPHIAQVGQRLINSLNNLFEKHSVAAACTPQPSNFRIIFRNKDLERFFYRGCAKRGILLYFYDNQNITYCHTNEDIAHTLEVSEAVLAEAARLYGRDARPIIEREDKLAYLKGKWMISRDVYSPDGF